MVRSQARFIGLSGARRVRMRPMVVLSAALHGLLAAGLVWGPTWIPRRPLAPVYEVQLVSLPVEAPRPRPEPPKAQPEPLVPPAPARPKPKTVKKPSPAPVEPAKPREKAAPAAIPEAHDEPANPEQPPESPKPESVAKTTEPTEPGIQLVTPLMEAVALKYPYYINALKRKINENWSPPGAGFAQAREVLVVFTILRDGRVSGPAIEQSSGDVFYDQAALRAVLRADPLPPLPDGYPGNDMKIHFSFLLDPDRMS